jgi:hypothetical protein
MRMYKQGLKLEVRAELIRSGATKDTLAQLITETIRLNNNLYELQLAKRSYG